MQSLWRTWLNAKVPFTTQNSSSHFRALPVVKTSFPVDIRPFYGDMTSFPAFPYYRPPLPVTSGRRDVISGRYTTVLWRYDVISGISLLSPTTSSHFRSSWRHFRPMYDRFTTTLRHFRYFPIIAHHFRSLPVVVTSFPADIRPYYGDMTSFPVFPNYRPPLPVTSGRRDVISGRCTTVLWRYDVISGISLLSPTTSNRNDVTSGWDQLWGSECYARASVASEAPKNW